VPLTPPLAVTMVYLSGELVMLVWPDGYFVPG